VEQALGLQSVKPIVDAVTKGIKGCKIQMAWQLEDGRCVGFVTTAFGCRYSSFMLSKDRSVCSVFDFPKDVVVSDMVVRKNMVFFALNSTSKGSVAQYQIPVAASEAKDNKTLKPVRKYTVLPIIRSVDICFGRYEKDDDILFVQGLGRARLSRYAMRNNVQVHLPFLIEVEGYCIECF